MSGWPCNLWWIYLTILLRERNVVHADETPVPQIAPGKGKAKKAYLWAYRSNDLEPWPPILVFYFQPGRHGLHARNFLEDWHDQLMVDDYAGYKALIVQGVTELACLAHTLRKFFDLYAASRLQIRQQEARPRLAALFAWLSQTRINLADCGGTAKALDYSIKRWPELIHYAENGILPIDNNPVENSIRLIAIGKKNWLFAFSERAGRRAEAIQGLLGTAKLNGLDPDAWLKVTLKKLPVWPYSRINELLTLSVAKP